MRMSWVRQVFPATFQSAVGMILFRVAQSPALMSSGLRFATTAMSCTRPLLKNSQPSPVIRFSCAGSSSEATASNSPATPAAATITRWPAARNATHATIRPTAIGPFHRNAPITNIEVQNTSRSARVYRSCCARRHNTPNARSTPAVNGMSFQAVDTKAPTWGRAQSTAMDTATDRRRRPLRRAAIPR